MGLFTTLKVKLGFQPEGSAFTKIAQAEDKVVQARGRIIAIDAANREKHQVASGLEVEVARVHQESDEVHSRLNNVLDRL